MKEIPSAQFRKGYARLTEPTVVTVNGHPIGMWLPGPIPEVEVSASRPMLPAGTEAMRAQLQAQVHEEFAKLPAGGIQARQAKRDALLNRINRSK